MSDKKNNNELVNQMVMFDDRPTELQESTTFEDVDDDNANLPAEIFSADIIEAAPKSTNMLMELPFFASAKTAKGIWETTIHEYAKGGDLTIKIIPGAEGERPTVYDEPLMLFLQSQIVAALNRGRSVSPVISFSGYEYILWLTGRKPGGHDYERLRNALRKLKETSIRANINLHKNLSETSEVVEDDPLSSKEQGFGYINGYTWGGPDEKIKLTIDPAMFAHMCDTRAWLNFNLTPWLELSATERAIYKLMRKHLGNQTRVFNIGIDKVLKKAGLVGNPELDKTATLEARKRLSKITKQQSLPDLVFFMARIKSKHRSKIQYTCFAWIAKDDEVGNARREHWRMLAAEHAKVKEVTEWEVLLADCGEPR